MAARIIWKCDICGKEQAVVPKFEDSAISENDRWSPNGWGVRNGKVLCDVHEAEAWAKIRADNPNAVWIAGQVGSKA